MSEWERAFQVDGQPMPSEPRAEHPKAYRRAVLSKLPHESEHERRTAMERWAREHGGGVAAFVAHELKSREAGEHERAYRERHGIQAGPGVPMLSQREIEAGITEFPTEGD